MSAIVEFYWRPGCPFCVALQRKLRKRQIPFTKVNIWEDPDAAARVRDSAGGNETVPTVFVGDRALVNPSIDQVETLVREVAPGLLHRADAPRRRRWWRR